MDKKGYNYKSKDPQGTKVEPLSIDDFDLEGYYEYEQEMLAANREFWQAEEGVAVHRRFRVPEVFSYACRDMKTSLELQLAALEQSKQYKMDIPNFLEPWYGIGTIASAFGLEYIWNKGQAPATEPPFNSIEEALKYDYKPVAETTIGQHTLEMIEFFLEKTKGKIPLSFTDTQSPLNIACYLVPMDKLFIEMYENPEGYKKLLSIASELLINFTHKQEELIGEPLVKPGHGFTSSREFTGLGMSDDNVIMISDDFFRRFELSFREKVGAEFGGCVFHSCGNWTNKIEVIKEIDNLVMVDGAFSAETDPDPNESAPFAEGFAGSGIIVNARIVGDPDTIVEKVEKLWVPGMKLIVVTYCKTPDEQEEAYNRIHNICSSH